jgi:hypothetical protein
MATAPSHLRSKTAPGDSAGPLAAAIDQSVPRGQFMYFTVYPAGFAHKNGAA